MPKPLEKVFLLTTGSETVECAIKLCRTHGVKVGGRDKNVIVSFSNAFHGRTLGSQQAGGIPALKEWIVNYDPGFVQLPFPDGYRHKDVSFEGFERGLREAGVEASQIAGVILETYQGGDAAFAPVEYMQALRRWCDQHQALLVCDEVQAGFGRTGKLWGFEHYGIVPDLTTWGKGMSSSLPIAGVAGRADVMDLHAPGSMTSTHSGNPVCCAAALASLEVILDEDLSGNAARVGALMHERFQKMADEHESIAAVMGKGLVAGIVVVDPATGEPDAELAADIVWRSLKKGVLMFSPVGKGGGTVKVAPPLCLTAEAAEESLDAFEQAVNEAASARSVVALA
jgi:4-aminobutyrate aminotransferase / (S)-3-amino-2-methylpropionate transaminase / 5-aminovalerate transaminase